MSTDKPNGQITPIAKKMDTVRDLLAKYQSQMTAALPLHKKRDAERMARIVLTEVARTPKLMDCTPASLIGAVLQAAAFGLEPGMQGDCWFIPRHNSRAGKMECNFQLGYRGLLKLARRSGEISSVQARVVHEKDVFDYAFGLDERLEHRPAETDEPGEVTFVYSVVRLKDGGAMFDVWTRGKVEAHRKQYAQSNSPAWGTSWDEMAKKTVLARVLKLAPASIELQTAIALDEQAEVGEPQDLGALVEGPEPVAPPSKLDALTETLQAKREVEHVGAGASAEPMAAPEPAGAPAATVADPDPGGEGDPAPDRSDPAGAGGAAVSEPIGAPQTMTPTALAKLRGEIMDLEDKLFPGPVHANERAWLRTKHLQGETLETAPEGAMMRLRGELGMLANRKAQGKGRR